MIESENKNQYFIKISNYKFKTTQSCNQSDSSVKYTRSYIVKLINNR